MDKFILKSNKSTAWEETYSFTNQYLCVLAAYLMEIVSLALNIIIYTSSGAPGYGKDVVGYQKFKR